MYLAPENSVAAISCMVMFCAWSEAIDETPAII